MADIKKTLPPSVGKMNVIGPILETIDPELDRVERETRSACQRLAVDTCDEKGAELWEKETGIEVRDGLPLAMRKTLIRLALRKRETCTPERLKAFLNQMLAGPVELTELFSDYALMLRVRITDFLVPSLTTVLRELRGRIPAHLDFSLEASAELQGAEGSLRMLHQGIRIRIAATEEETE